MVPCYLTALVSEPSGGKKTGGESLLLLVARGVPRPMANSFADGRVFQEPIPLTQDIFPRDPQRFPGISS